MFRSLKQDKKFGEDSELNNKSFFDFFFNQDFKKLSPFDVMDFEGSKCYLEVKTRNNEFNKYPTTMIPMNKIEFAKTSLKTIYFVFVFTDNTYYIKYEEDKFKNYFIKKFKRDDRIDHKDIEKDYLYIPITDLLKMS